ncbi:hypothetical protein WQ54_29920 [Bacillus sp. SA1-12]|uniref:hypothetical protein n=1 Tax=Bacillus sp. SA1-12 TaxID=1455638 RepID=UPI000627476A|nr:hypothetical protein [Bacillus sp. SA1-12]KKI88729.1 hypothetical protein WQ54_29920 [Bacillus sp. SA1-12]
MKNKHEPVDMRVWKTKKVDTDKFWNNLEDETNKGKDELDLINENNIMEMWGNEIISWSSKDNVITMIFSNEKKLMIRINKDGRLEVITYFRQYYK